MNRWVELSVHKVGVLRGPNLNPYEGQYFEKLGKYGFQPIGITTHDKEKHLPEITFPIRAGHNLRTLTKGKLTPIFSLVGRATKYNFESWNLRIIGLSKLVKDLDIIHSADIWYPFTYQAVKTGKPTIATEWENIPFNVKGKPYLKIQEYNRQHVTHFIAITKKAKEALLTEKVDPERISVIPAGINCDRFKPTAKTTANRFGVSDNSTKILFVGRLTPEKGIFELLNAFSLMIKKHENIELLIAGSGTQKMLTQISELAESLKIQSKVKFFGSVCYSEMAEIHNLADIFCLPSVETDFWAEQFGYALVEAMACEKPVVSTITGSIPEIVKDRVTGILVEQKNPVALQLALEELLLDKKEREQLGRNGREWVLEAFEANKIAKQLASLYEQLI
jgi:glycosyltransferase involved in cell wall biosynthesis